MVRGSSSNGAAANTVLAPWLDHYVHEDDAEQCQRMVGDFSDERGDDEDEESEHGGHSDDDGARTPPAATTSLPLASTDETWGDRGRRYQDLGRFTDKITSSAPLRPRGAMADRMAKPPDRKSVDVQQPPRKAAAVKQTSSLRTTPKAASRPADVAPAIGGNKRKREHTATDLAEENALRDQAVEDSRRRDMDEVLFGEGVLHYADVDWGIVDALILKIGGRPTTFRLKSFDVLSARAFAPVIRSLEVDGEIISPLTQAILWAGIKKARS